MTDQQKESVWSDFHRGIIIGQVMMVLSVAVPYLLSRVLW